MDTPRSVLERNLDLAVGPSPRLAAIVVAVRAGAALSTLILEGPLWLRLSLLAWMLVPALRWQRRQRHGAGDTVEALRLRSDGRFEVCRAGEWAEAALVSADVVEPWLTVMVFRPSASRRCAAILLPDNVDPQAFRRLRARLRLGIFHRGDGPAGVPGAAS